MRVLVCGGREYADSTRIFHVLDMLHLRHEFTSLIHGGARGVDTIAGQWALRRGVSVTVFLAEWSRHGRAAGPIRNQQMLTCGAPDMVVAFPGGHGTGDMVRRARRAGVSVREYLR